MVNKTQPPFSPAMLETLRIHEQSPYLGGHLVAGKDGVHSVTLTAEIDKAAFVIYEMPSTACWYTMGINVCDFGDPQWNNATMVTVAMPGYRVVSSWFEVWSTPHDLAAYLSALLRFYSPRSAWMNDGDISDKVYEELEDLRDHGMELPHLASIECYEDRQHMHALATSLTYARALLRKHRLIVPSQWIVEDIAQIPHWNWEGAPGGAELALPWLYAIKQAYLLRYSTHEDAFGGKLYG